MDRDRDSGRHPQGHHRQAQCRGECGAEVPGTARPLQEARRRGKPRHARGLRGIHRAGGPEMAGDGQARRRERRMNPLHRRHDGGTRRRCGRLLPLALMLVATLAATLAPRIVPAYAQSYPNRPIKLIVAVLPGGPMDVMGRLMAQHLSATFGQVFVENRAGAGTTLGAKAVASAEPDGYTLLLGNAATLAIGPTLYKSAGYDPLASFAPVAFVSSVPYVMIASPDLPVRNAQQLVAYAKAHPGKLSFGVANAAPNHMLAAWFKARTGTDVVIVPYKGASAVLTDMLGGQIQAGFETTSVLFGHLKENKIRALAVAT